MSMTTTMIHDAKEIITEIDKREVYDTVRLIVKAHDGSTHYVTIFGDSGKPIKITKKKPLKE